MAAAFLTIWNESIWDMEMKGQTWLLLQDKNFSWLKKKKVSSYTKSISE